jgi:hypothetical protein
LDPTALVVDGHRDRGPGDLLHPVQCMVTEQGGGVPADEDPADLRGAHRIDDRGRVGGVDPDDKSLGEPVARCERRYGRRAGVRCVGGARRCRGCRQRYRGCGRGGRRPDRDDDAGRDEAGQHARQQDDRGPGQVSAERHRP